MPILALLIIALQIFCGVHAARNGHAYPWLFIIIIAPLIGSIIYMILIMLPEMQRVGAQAAKGITKVIDPDRDYRARRREAELVGSADSKRALAEECIRRGDFAEAVTTLEGTLVGVHADDPVLLYALARARFMNDDPVGAQRALDDLRASNPEWNSPDAHLIYARALEEQGKTAEALEDYAALIRYFPGEEARCRYALLLKKEGRSKEARALLQQVIDSVDGAPKHYREAQSSWLTLARRNLTQ
jgi:hypothetical protein